MTCWKMPYLTEVCGAVLPKRINGKAFSIHGLDGLGIWFHFADFTENEIKMRNYHERFNAD